MDWVQTKRHRLWFSTKTCSCSIEFDFDEKHNYILKSPEHGLGINMGKKSKPSLKV